MNSFFWTTSLFSDIYKLPPDPEIVKSGDSKIFDRYAITRRSGKSGNN